ncbi:MAG: TIGR00153 family protein [Gammaproteobacteria bacterium]|nr:TIGR00153 family protein [Gammaproteobacteria bacterium]
MAPRNPFTNLFVKSPMGPLQDHMSKVHATTRALVPFLKAAQKGDWEMAKTLQKEVVKLEHEADKQKRAVRRHLPKSLFMPVSRSDLLELVSVQDHIANASKDVAGLMLGRKMAFPEKVSQDLLDYAEASVDTTKQAMIAVQGIDSLLEVGFSSREVSSVEDKIGEINTLEHRTDKLQIKLRARLFKLENDLPPVEVMFLYQIIDWLGSIADHAEKVGSRLQVLIVL